MAAKLLAHRIGVKVNEDVHHFEPAEWLTAHGDGGDPAAIGFKFDAAKLKKSVLEFYKETPEKSHNPPWLANFKQLLGGRFND